MIGGEKIKIGVGDSPGVVASYITGYILASFTLSLWTNQTLFYNSCLRLILIIFKALGNNNVSWLDTLSSPWGMGLFWNFGPTDSYEWFLTSANWVDIRYIQSQLHSAWCSFTLTTFDVLVDNVRFSIHCWHMYILFTLDWMRYSIFVVIVLHVVR